MNKLVKYFYDNEYYLSGWAITFCYGNKMDAEDLIYDCMMRICQMKDEQIKDKSFKSFWITSLKNKAIDNKRNYLCRINNTVKLLELKNASINSHVGLDVDIIHSAIRSLSYAERNIIQLIAQGYPNKDVAEKLEISNQQVRTLTMRARIKLRKKLLKVGIL